MIRRDKRVAVAERERVPVLAKRIEALRLCAELRIPICGGDEEKNPVTRAHRLAGDDAVLENPTPRVLHRGIVTYDFFNDVGQEVHVGRQHFAQALRADCQDRVADERSARIVRLEEERDGICDLRIIRAAKRTKNLQQFASRSVAACDRFGGGYSYISAA